MCGEACLDNASCSEEEKTGTGEVNYSYESTEKKHV